MIRDIWAQGAAHGVWNEMAMTVEGGRAEMWELKEAASCTSFRVDMAKKTRKEHSKGFQLVRFKESLQCGCTKVHRWFKRKRGPASEKMHVTSRQQFYWSQPILSLGKSSVLER